MIFFAHELVQKHVYSEVFQDNVSPQLLLILDWIICFYTSS